MAGQLGGIPILVLKEGSERTRGREAQSTNINAAKAVASAVRTTLGPKGMDKMLVDALGDVVITNDGVTILKEMEIESPAAKMMVEVAKTVDEVAGDGTTTAVVIGGELLKKAEDLLEQELHPSVISLGYRLAAERAIKVLDEIATGIDIEDDEELKKIARTAITGKFAEDSRDFLAEIAIKAVKAITETGHEGKRVVDTDNISVEKKVGGRIGGTELVQGMAIDKEVVHPGMPRKVEDAKIALINAALEVKKTETSAEVKIRTSDQLKGFLAEEERMMRRIAECIKESGANVVICQKGIDDLVQHYLAKDGVVAVRRAKKSDMEKLEKATGGKIVTNVEELSKSDLGHAGLVEERKIAGGKMLFIEECENPHALSIVIRGGTEYVVDEVERALHDMLRVVGCIIEDGKAVAGGGAVETELALRVREYSASLKGREQLAVDKFAEAMEIIPRTLAENSGLDPIDKLVELKAAHERGEKNAGLDAYTGKIVDMWQGGVIEPLRTKRQSVESAVDAAVMILRIDDVISSKKGAPPAGGAPPGGMGGMPPY
ncbi:MAG: TCP-1/cpn60 chaperonin family protein [Candidatus Syntrophoarchaeum sp.]|nr:TCP-1/cpn60 chaperonin family protein [Candidatus Syntrophoarchaeum sp.]